MILVVAAVIVDELRAPTRILTARRRTPAALAGYWEFPGGKVETGEDPLAALQRELAEELGIAVDLGVELVNPEGPSWPISAQHDMRLWFAAVSTGTPRPTGSHDDLRWLGPSELDDVDWLPAHATIAAELRRFLAP